MELCKILNVTPKQLGKLRRDDPRGIYFIENYIAWEASEKHKAYKEAEKKSKLHKGRRR